MRIVARVPATSANLGPGFDCIGLALDIYNDIELDTERSIHDEEHLVYKAVNAVFEYKNIPMMKIDVNVTGSIPIERGLGSSASCIVGGIVAANRLLGDIMSLNEMIDLAVKIEGHPDNIVPAFVGGIAVSIRNHGNTYYKRFDVPGKYKFEVMIPDFKLPTKIAREVLPEMIPRKDAVFNIGRAAFLIAGLLDDGTDIVNLAFEDKIHQPYRKILIPNYDEIFEYASECDSIGTFLSGAGPAIIAVADRKNLSFLKKMKKRLDLLNNKWDIIELNSSNQGVAII